MKIVRKIKSSKHKLVSWRTQKIYEKGKSLPIDGPLVSIIMTVYNRELYVKKAIESVLKQSYKNFELIIVNDGSIDSSEEKIKECLGDKRIKYFYKENSGQLDTFRYAHEQCTGQYITRLDSDDLLNPKAISFCMYEVLNSKQKIDFIYFDLMNIDQEGNLRGIHPIQNYEANHHVIRDVFKNFYSVIPDQSFWNRDYVHNVIKFYIEENIPFYMDNINNYNFKKVNLPLYLYRQHESNFVNNIENLKFVLSGINKMIDYIVTHYDFSYYLTNDQLKNPYYYIAERYYEEALKYVDGTFGSYRYNENDKVYQIFKESAIKWIDLAEDDSLKRSLYNSILNIGKK